MICQRLNKKKLLLILKCKFNFIYSKKISKIFSYAQNSQIIKKIKNK
jgi:hypothetical protein